ncbi:oxidoreductase OpS5 [Drosophila grimshawi]|uniref:GH12566 n=1 Tax=Drosophila grimshawi TaxID=7222 RepID=B4JK02_DROGR|nr:oxidoreductase OpS5 [Drosophila grimshawi]EDV99904.1 GH12566 [Drosophila grimshawi]
MQMNLLKTFVLISSLIIVQIDSIQDADGKRIVSKYESIQQLYPQLTAPSSESSQWRYADKDMQHPCKRECVEQQPMTCYYYMVIHYDDTMAETCKRYLQSKYRFKLNGKEYIDGFKLLAEEPANDDCKYADGLESLIMVVNGKLPGQSIDVCYGDTIVADVINSMHETTTIHWHGIHQRSTPHMDGVPHVTQYPIEAGQAFRYRFEVDHVGTNWWHSHTEHQRAFGLAGPLIVRQPIKLNPHAHLYDYDQTEHVIMIQDWVHNFDESIAENILINGRGRNMKKDSRSMPTLYSMFQVVRGGRYRFRVIFNGVSNCPISLSIDKHDLVVISTDGNDIEPIEVQKIMFHGAERFDFVLHANQEVANYWLRIKGYTFCAKNQLHQEAILHYHNADPHDLDTSTLSYAYDAPGIMLNELGDDAGGDSAESISLVSLNAHHLQPSLNPATTYYTSMNAFQLQGEGFRFQMDDITFTMPKMSLLQTRNLGIGQFFCNRSQQASLGFNCRSRHCKCSNVINVPANKNVEFVISSKSNTAHPIHLHGYTFRVVGMGVLGEERIGQIEQIDRRTPLPRRGRGAPLKDSVQVPAFGYTIIHFNSNSPGYWIFHCHISTHSENGMAAVVRVGEDAEMKMCPISNCGLCSSVA